MVPCIHSPFSACCVDVLYVHKRASCFALQRKRNSLLNSGQQQPIHRKPNFRPLLIESTTTACLIWFRVLFSHSGTVVTVTVNRSTVPDHTHATDATHTHTVTNTQWCINNTTSTARDTTDSPRRSLACVAVATAAVGLIGVTTVTVTHSAATIDTSVTVTITTAARTLPALVINVAGPSPLLPPPPAVIPPR